MRYFLYFPGPRCQDKAIKERSKDRVDRASIHRPYNNQQHVESDSALVPRGGANIIIDTTGVGAIHRAGTGILPMSQRLLYRGVSVAKCRQYVHLSLSLLLESDTQQPTQLCRTHIKGLRVAELGYQHLQHSSRTPSRLEVGHPSSFILQLF